MDKSFFSIDKTKGFMVVILSLMIYYVPYIILGENSFITLHDNLDGYWANVVTQSRFKEWISTGFPVMDGTFEYRALPDWINYKIILLFIFNPFHAYIISDVLIRTIGGVFMYLLLADFILKDANKYAIAAAFSIIFVFIPFYTVFGLTTTGVPFIIYCILNIFSKQWIKTNYFLLSLIPFFSTLPLFGFYICFAIGILLFYFMIKKDIGRIKPLFVVEFLMSFGYIITNIGMVEEVLNPAEPSFRSSWHLESTWGDITKDTIAMALQGQYHYGVYFSLFALFSVIIDFKNIWSNRLSKYILYIIIGILVFTFCFAALKMYIPAVQSIQFDRFYLFLTPLWIVLFAIVTDELERKRKFLIFNSFLIIASFISVIFSNKEFVKNSLLTLGVDKNFITYKDFYAVDLFERIKQENKIEDFKTKVVSIGMFPSVAMYNGFHTIDTYQSLGSRRFNMDFRDIICEELNKSIELKNYYDCWGGRRYIYSSEVGKNYLVGKSTDISIKKLEINIDKLNKMKCQYVISSIPIENSDDLNLYLVNTYTSSDSFWNIRLYKIKL